MVKVINLARTYYDDGFIAAVLCVLLSVVIVLGVRADDGDHEVDASGCLKPNSDRCRLDCTADSYDFICVDDAAGNWSVLRSDLDAIGGLKHQVNVYFWNLQATSFQVESDIFGQAEPLLARLSLMNLPGLTKFPMLREATNLVAITILQADNLLDFSTELLPRSIRNISLFQTGITRLENDFIEVPSLPNVQQFVISNGNISFIESNFFKVFSQVSEIVLDRNAFNLTDKAIADGMFTTLNSLQKFALRNNNFTIMKPEDRVLFFQMTMRSLNVSKDTVVDLSNNRLEVEQETLDCIRALKDVKELSLRGNPFRNSMSITNLFLDFKNLRSLDLSDTNLPISNGTFASLYLLDELRLGYNGFGDMTAVDMFKGSKSTMLRVLDLSYNSLTALPDGDIQSVGSYLEELDLMGNNLLPFEFPQYADLVNETDPVPTFASFLEIRFLDLSWNNWTAMDGRLLTPLRNLQTVDLSCNWFQHITRDFFSNMPRSLKTINMTFCLSTFSPPPQIDPDAFSTLPPIQTFILARGSLRNWIFDRLMQLSNETMQALQHVLLQDNNIRFLDGDKFAAFANWKTLNLRGNTLQSLGASSLKKLTSLRTLILSQNQLISIDVNDMVGLDNLEQLDLHGNKISNIDSGSFDMLPRLRSLYLGQNNLSNLDTLFVTGGDQLLHFGFQRNAIGCIRRQDLQPLKKLRWIYMGDPTTPVFVDRNDDSETGSLQSKIYKEPFASGDDLDCDPNYDSPLLKSGAGIDPDTLFQTDFIRLSRKNPWDLTPRNFISHVAKCYISQLDRNLTNITENFFCAMSDSKTAGSGGLAASSGVVLGTVLMWLIFEKLSYGRRLV
ncbi:transforming growth factor beta activator LRRC33-like [Paramacrobiotus metropolitanus]|uniref:transforming growth factor beta activator LRRC33-like n=1 Tax=Paramacrobiotus metropolitanus TaxID=2943436 RepID=UPI0024456F81|nr:transforming growth factor beta activator LRRC33-like [Paramacrobiotus metropolitanus]